VSPRGRWLGPARPPVVSAWNGAHALGRRAGAYLGALARGRFGRCEACGRVAPLLYHRGVVPPRLEALWGLSPRLAEALARKESLACGRCGAKLRARRLARVLLDLYPVGDPPRPAASVRAWAGTPEARALRVAEINLVEGLHGPLARLPRLAFSDFRDGAGPGALVGGVRSEDLTRLTYPDDAFDLVVTSETLEHVPDLGAALAEVRRVLAPGGRHVFTVPLLPGVPRTFPRARLRPDGTIDALAPTIRHPGGDAGYPVFTEFGADLPEILAGAGFEVEVRFGPPTEDDLAQVFVCRKPAGDR
jgi:SAM-dependent methyltransferase